MSRLHLGNLHDAFDHRQRVGIQQIAFVGTLQQLDQLLAIFRLAHKQRAKPFEQ